MLAIIVPASEEVSVFPLFIDCIIDPAIACTDGFLDSLAHRDSNHFSPGCIQIMGLDFNVFIPDSQIDPSKPSAP